MKTNVLFVWVLCLLSTTALWAVDLNESFDDTFFPPVHWQAVETGDGVNNWHRNNFNTHSGSGCAEVSDEDVGGVAERWLITPRLFVNSAADTISFWARTTFSFISDDDSLYVLLSTTDSLPASFTTLLAQYKCGDGGAFINVYAQFILSLAGYQGQDIFVAFLHRDAGDGGNELLIDDVVGPELQAAPDRAATPSPAHEAVGVPPNSNLTWVNGDLTTTIDLYLAQTQDSIDNNIPAARKINNVLATLYDPPLNLVSNQQYFWKVVTRNFFGDTQGPVWSFTVLGGPLSGSYDLGGGNNDYATFNEVVNALYGNGVSGPVTIHVYGTDYEERIELVGDIPGVSSTNLVTFSDASGTARILDSTATTSSVPVIHLQGVDYVTFDGIDVWASGETDICVTFNVSAGNGATNNVVRNATLTSHTASTVSRCVRMLGNGNNNNLLENLTCISGNYSMLIGAVSDGGSSGNIIQNCTMSGAQIGVQVSNQANLIIRNNDIQCNWTSSSDPRWGMDVTSSFGANSSVDFCGNRVHNLRTTSGTGAGLARTQAGGGVIRIYNNFCWDFTVSGAGVARGVYTSGAHTCEIYNNSILINAFTTTGNFMANVYAASSSTILRIRNNIFVNENTTGRHRNIYCLLVPTNLELDYNFYSGVDTILTHSSTYVSVAAIQAGTVFEDHGLEGTPGFVSATDLHINPAQGQVNMNAQPISYITTDIDGNARTGSPDIGADEYVHAAANNDYAVREFIAPLALYEISTVYPVNVRVQNRGSSAQTNVPVRLFYNGTQQAELLVSLAAQETDTVQFSWTTPAAPSSGTLETQSFLGADATPANDSTTASIQIISPPLQGPYDIGGGANNYATIIAAVADAVLRGVSGPVTFHVYAATYNGPVVVGSIPGASAVNTVTFVEAGALATPPEIVSTTSPALQFNGANHVVFDNIDITLTINGRVVEMTGDADFNTVKNCAIVGASSAGTTNYGVYVIGGGNDNNVIENAAISGSHYGVRLSGITATSDLNNEVRGCTMTDGRYGVYLERQDGARIHHNDIQPGNAGSVELYGVFGTTHSSGTTSYVYNNEIHNIRSNGGTNVTNGINCSVGTGATMVSYNNMVYGWTQSGTGVLYGLRTTSGTGLWYHNSIRINDVATTGNIYGFYMTGASTNATAQNNILEVDEASEECWSLYLASGVLTSDYNVVYGTGSGYNVGFSSAANRLDLAAWNANTGLDGNSAQGDPGYVDNTNLHIAPTFSLCDGAGVTIGTVTTDFDDETRDSPPDIGADEYDFTSLAHDYGIYSFVGLAGTYVGGVPHLINVDVQNFGTNAEVNVPVRLYYNNVLATEILLSLAAGVRDTITMSWTPPAIDFEIGALEAQAFLGTDAFHDNDSATAVVTVIGPPMNGTYDMGGGNMDFATFNEAVSALSLRGIDGEVIIDCYDGTYNESVTLTSISGTNFADRVIFREHPSALADVVVLTNGVATRVVYVDGADFVTFDGIDIVATGATNICVELDNDADYITFQNLSFTSPDSTSTSTRGAKVNFDGNDNATFDNITVRGAFYGIRSEGGTGPSDNLVVSHCDISGASYGVYLDDCHNSRIHDNDIQPHGYASTSAYGVYIASLTAGDTVYVYNNRIHNLRHTNSGAFPDMAGINSLPTSVAYVYNNFIYDFAASGPGMSGIRGGTGTTYAYNNSVLMNDVAAADEYAGLYVSTGTMHAVNNIFVVEEQVDTCYAIWRAGGTLATSNYNAVYGTGAGYWTGRDGTTPYLTLLDWQGLGYDLNSVAGNPGYVSGSDLHIQPSFILVDGAGTTLSLVTDDIDGDSRQSPPDIGADEYNGIHAPDAVVDLTVLRVDDTNDVILSWSATANAQSYRIYVDTDHGNIGNLANLVGVTGLTNFTHVNGVAQPGSRHFYVVVASTDPAP